MGKGGGLLLGLGVSKKRPRKEDLMWVPSITM